MCHVVHCFFAGLSPLISAVLGTTCLDRLYVREKRHYYTVHQVIMPFSFSIQHYGGSRRAKPPLPPQAKGRNHASTCFRHTHTIFQSSRSFLPDVTLLVRPKLQQRIDTCLCLPTSNRYRLRRKHYSTPFALAWLSILFYTLTDPASKNKRAKHQKAHQIAFLISYKHDTCHTQVERANQITITAV